MATYWTLREPPTSAAPMAILGTVCPYAHRLRPVGMLSSSSRVKTCWVVALCTSMTGDAPDTVTLSSIDPMLNWASTGAVKPAVSSIPSRTTFLNPASVKATRYVPERRSMTL